MKYSPSLAAILDQATNKKAWALALFNALGTSLTFKCKRDSNANATDPFTTGTLFCAATLSGPPRIVSNNLVNLGYTSKATVNLPADLTTGKSVLRIEANGHWIEGSLGLNTSSSDFRVRKNPTATSGISLKSVTISPRKSLPSGTGPLAPEPTALTTVAAIIEDMSYPAVPFEVGKLLLDLPREHMVFEDAELANEMGDIRITQTNKTVVFGQFEFGITRFDMDKSLNAQADTPVEQGLVYCKPYGVWPTYPFGDTWRPDRDLTYPKPFRVRLLRADGTTWKTLQMRDGLPINDPSLMWDGWPKDNPRALRPHWSCGMMLPWQSHLAKHSSNLNKYSIGMEPDSVRDSQAKEGSSSNAAIPLATASGQVNAQLQYNAAPQWPIPFDSEWGGRPEYNAMNTFDDPYLFDITRYHGGEGGRSGVSGWDYEPGSISQHDHLAYKGGLRHDRSCIPHMLAKFATDPLSVRQKGKVPYRRLADAYGLAMFNMPYHYVQDINKCIGIPTDLVMKGEIAFVAGRYMGGSNAVPLGDKRCVNLWGLGDGTPWPRRQRDSHHTWGGWQQDHLHNSMSPALWTIIFNSPMHIVSGAMRYAGSVMCQAGMQRPTTNARGYWMERHHAFRWLQHIVQWKAGTKHFLGRPQGDIEKNFQIEIERCYDDVLVPTKITNDPHPYYEGLRKLGMHMEIGVRNAYNPDKLNPAPQEKYLTFGHDTKTFYFAHMLVMMRQFGLWKVMRAKSEKCRLTLDFLIECLDRFGIEAIYHTEGRCSVNTSVGPGVPLDGPDPKAPNGWADWNINSFPKKGMMDMVTEEDGSVTSGVSPGQNATLHFRTQYALMRPVFFPEHPHPLMNDCATMIRGFYKKHTDMVKARATLRQQAMSDWGSRWGGSGIIAAPSVLESENL